MRKFTFGTILIALFLFVSGVVLADVQNATKTIVMITDANTNGGDVAQTEWLKANGFNITILNVGTDIDLNNPDQEDVDALNAADLVIIGRDVNSSMYDGSGQDVVDNITAPVLTNNPYGAQWGVPPLWYPDQPTMETVTQKNLYIQVTADPIFANSHVVGDSINYATGCAFVVTDGPHNGVVLGKNNGNIGIVRFAKGVPYNSATGAKTPKSPRTIFAFQNTATTFSLNADGQAAYYGEIRRMMGLPIEAPKVYAGNNSEKVVIMITDPNANGGDVAQTEWLKANGFNITVLNLGTDIDLKAPDQEDIDALNDADLVIIGRDVNSSKYDGVGQDVVDNITAPVITCNPYGAQWGVPPLWFAGQPTMETVSQKNLAIQVTDDPIFTYSNVVGGSINYASGCAFVVTAEQHNGMVLGTNNGNIGIVRFAPGKPYNSDAGAKTPKSPRTIFPFENTATAFSLNADGQAAYYAEIRRMMGMSIEAPKVYAGNDTEKTIVMITDPNTNGGDIAQTEWLKANGFNITVINVDTDIDLKAPDQEDVDALNDADLVIIGRDVNSSKYDGVGQDVVDNITAPVLTCNPYGAQWGVPPLWFAGQPTMETVLEKNLAVQVIDDPIFTYSNVVGGSINYANGCAFVVTEESHNGMVLGTNNGNIGIVRFASGVPYNSEDGAKTPKSPRTIFPFQNTATTFSLNADGQAAYYAEISRMMGLPIKAPKVYAGNNSERSIVVLTDDAHGGDVAILTFLKDNGFNATKVLVNDAMIANPSQGLMDTLNTADLIVYGRDAWSNVQNAIDSTTTPVIYANPYGAQWGSPDKFWFLDATMNTVSDKVVITVDDDPIFANSVVVGDSMDYATGAAFVVTSEPHNGKVIGSYGTDIGIFRFTKGVPYNSDPAAKTPNSDHTIFPFQTSANAWTLTHNGQAAYYAEIRRMLGLSMEAPKAYYDNNASKKLVVLTDDAHGGDVALLTFLNNNGFDVTKVLVNDAIIENPSVEFIDTLNTADLIVYGRDAWSNVQNAVDVTTTPVIHANTYGAQWGSPDKFWFLDATMNTVSDKVVISVVGDPIFANSHVMGDTMNYATGAAFVVTPKPHNGTVIGSFGTDIGIVRFVKDVPYNSDAAAKTPKSDHTIFPFQTGTKTWTLTHEGQAAYYAEIRRLLGMPIEAPNFYYNNPSANSMLASLTASGGTLTPDFSPEVTVYTLVVPAASSPVTLTTVAADAKATVEGDGLVAVIPSTITIMVTAEDGISMTDYIVEVSWPTAINDFNSNGIRIYPNPTNGIINIDGLVQGTNVEVLNMVGQVIFNSVATSDHLTFDISGYDSGIYICKIVRDGKSFTSKFIKQ